MSKTERRIKRKLDAITRQIEHDMLALRGRLVKNRPRSASQREIVRISRMEYKPLTRRQEHG